MDWMHMARLLAVATAAIALVGALGVTAMVWLLKHPED